jgi:hypothetical protein
MPFKDGDKQRDYMRRYMREYMRKQRKLQIERKQELLKQPNELQRLAQQFPTVYELLFGKTGRKNRK